jgi:hypothetical protein
VDSKRKSPGGFDAWSAKAVYERRSDSSIRADGINPRNNASVGNCAESSTGCVSVDSTRGHGEVMRS